MQSVNKLLKHVGGRHSKEGRSKEEQTILTKSKRQNTAFDIGSSLSLLFSQFN